MTGTPRTFDRVPYFDTRSRAYPIRTLVEAKPLRSYTWSCLPTLDQGSEGACVGFAWAHDHAARPRVHDTSTDQARALYYRAKELDPWPGENYDGTAVLAGAQASVEQGHFTEYRWCFTLNDVLLAVGYTGPVVLGINWWESMYDPDVNGYIKPEGRIVGGHAILARGVSITRRDVTLRNSWGPDYGINGGDARITWDDLAVVLAQDGEACAPVGRLP